MDNTDSLIAVHSFQCQFCEEVFSSSIQIAQHWQDHHREDRIGEECVTGPVYELLQTSTFTVTQTAPSQPVLAGQCTLGQEAFHKNLISDGVEATDTNQHISRIECNGSQEDGGEKVFPDTSTQSQRPISSFESESSNKVNVSAKSTESKATAKSSSKDFCCELCGKTYTTTSNLNKHFLTHSGVLFNCGFCKKSFRYKESLKKHERNHLRRKNRKSDRGFACQYCHKIFPDRSKLSIHFRSHPLEKTYRCDKCERTFLYKSGLKRHILSHASVKAHACPQCDQSFVTAHNLKAHIKIHSDQKLFSCDKCDRAFAKKLTLVDHMRIHEDTRSYKCSHCGKGFRQRSTLWGHEKIHKRAKVHACCKCEESFGTLKDLKRHEKKHWMDSRQRGNDSDSKDRSGSGFRFECDRCGEKFSQKAVLQTHYRRHTGEMPFTCKVCGKKFRHLASHRRHALSHNNVKKFHCGECGKSFSKKSYLDWHLSKSQGTRGSCSIKKSTSKPSNQVTSVEGKQEDSDVEVSLDSYDGIDDDSDHCISPAKVKVGKEESQRRKSSLKFVDSTSKESRDHKSQMSSHTTFQMDSLNTPENPCPEPIEGPSSLMVSFEEVCDVPINEECVHTMNIIDHVMQLAQISQEDLEESHIPANEIPSVQADPAEVVMDKIMEGNESMVQSNCMNQIPPAVSDSSRTVKQYVCELCGRMYSLNSSLQRHMKTHVTSKPHKCCFCDKSYSRKPLLREHITFFHSGLHKPHQCTYCEKSFPNATRLNLHLRTHTHDKPFKCGVCDKRFTDSSNLGRHERSHQKLRRHKCQQCGQLFSEKPALQRHLARHQGDKVYQCQDCPKSFALKTDLQSHSTLHQAAKDTRCSLCGLTFQRQIAFKRHQACTKKSSRKCRVCSIVWPNECRRRQHEYGQHKLMITDSGLGCGYCKENFSKLGETVSHIREHYEVASRH